MRLWLQKPLDLLRYPFKHPEETGGILIPVTISVLDVAARWAIGISLEDAGADMALLGISLGIAVILLLTDKRVMEHSGAEGRSLTVMYLPGTLMFLVLALAAWLGCLKLVSSRSPFAEPVAQVVVSVGLGFVTLLGSTRVFREVLKSMAGTIGGAGS